ncbi:MAG TPA: PAS domain S-box protein [Polyangiaceae bacterium]|nr:PAS domain S-box protein [Polyangiaceae bacterium]
MGPTTMRRLPRETEGPPLEAAEGALATAPEPAPPSEPAGALRGALAAARARAEAAERRAGELARRAARLEAVLSAMDDAVAVADERGEIVWQNAAAERLFERAPDGAPDGGVAEAYGLARADGAARAPDDGRPVGRALAGERVTHGELFVRTRGAPEGRWHSVHAAPLPGGDGPGGVVLVGRDVTAQKETEGALREREARLRMLGDAAFEGISVSFDGKVIDGNEAFAAMFGYARGDLIGMGATAFVHPSERARVAARHLGGSEDAYETVGLRRDGSTFPLEVRGRMVPWGGRTVRITAMRDLTERARAEQATRLHGEILANMAEGVCLVRASDARILYANPTFAGMFGYAPGELDGRPIATLHPDGAGASAAERVGALVARLRAAGRAEYEVPNLHKDGSTVWCRATTSTMDHPEHGEVWVAVQEDVTERKRAEAALARQTAFVELLRATATEANAAETAEAALRACVTRVCGHMGWPVGHVYAVAAGAGGPELAPTGLWHVDDAARFGAFLHVTMKIRLPAGVDLLGRVLAEGRAQWLTDVGESGGFVRRAAARASGLRGGFAFPVLVGREVAAVLEFYSERFEEPDAPLLEVMANLGLQLGRVFERERARLALERHAAEIQKLSATDELTGLHNRRGFFALAAARLERADASGRPALLFFADLNGMKQINDALGHEAGDEAIRAAARLLRAAFREGDVLARLGGDEFVALASDAGPELLEALRQRLGALVDEDNAGAGGRPFRLSLSLGAAVYDPARPRRLGALLAEADALMYKQKRLRKLAGSAPPAAPPPAEGGAPPTPPRAERVW